MRRSENMTVEINHWSNKLAELRRFSTSLPIPRMTPGILLGDMQGVKDHCCLIDDIPILSEPVLRSATHA